jgi:ferrous iron transport protein A
MFLLVIDNQSHYMGGMSLRLDQLPFRTPARVTGIDWSRLPESDARRLRNLGFDEGVRIEALHGAPFGRDPLAIRIGRMMVAMRRAQAQAVSVETIEP